MGLKLATNLNWVTGAVFLPLTVRLSPLGLARWGWLVFLTMTGSCATSQKTLMWTVPGPEEFTGFFEHVTACSIVELLAFAFAKQNLWKQQGRSTRDFSRHPEALLRNTVHFKRYRTECLGNVFFPGDSKCPFHPLVGGHLTPWKGHLTIPKRSRTESPGSGFLKKLRNRCHHSFSWSNSCVGSAWWISISLVSWLQKF